MKSYIVEYIWRDSNNDFRSKTRVLRILKQMPKPLQYGTCYDSSYPDKDTQAQFDSELFKAKNFLLEDVPIWNYDGSSTGQAEGKDSEVFLKPAVLFKDPFRRDKNAYLVWCDMIDKDGNPLKNSTRIITEPIFENHKDLEPWFGLEQEYFIINPNTNLPLGFEVNKNPAPQGKYYCSIGSNKALGRDIPEIHLDYCLYAGIKICGVNAEVAPGQWEYQIGPCEGISASDELWVSRYILNRIAEEKGLNISYHPKPLGSAADWNGSGCHTNFSTNKMRNENGMEEINKAINRLSNNHAKHMENYGEDNKQRMSGLHETSSYDVFTFGRANRGASVRIPNQVLNENKGYFEDRRPAANCDPYLVTSLILETTNEPRFDLSSSVSPYDMVNLGFIV